MLIFVHVPKCGGTSLRNLIKQLFPLTTVEDYYFQYIIPFSKDPLRNLLWNFRELRNKLLLKMNLAECIVGHFSLNRHKNKYPDATYITFLRDPIKRVISSFFHYKKSVKVLAPNNPLAKIASQDNSILEFASHKSSKSIYRDLLGERDIEDFQFVGILEEYDKSIEVLEKEILKRKIPYKKLKLNVNKKAKKNNEEQKLLEQYESQLKEILKEEIFIYEKAKKRLSSYKI